MPHDLGQPALTLALALAAGIVAQALARHLRIPGIVVLLGVGVLLGPDVADLVRPDTLGQGLFDLIGFAVAVILFEGGLGLDVRRLRHQSRAIPQLITIGALVTTAGAALAARWIMGWDWRTAVLFGTLVIVTGPTVVTPLLKRIKVQREVATVLEAEGVFIDAIGAIIAVVALEGAMNPQAEFLESLLHVVQRLGFGALFGGVVGLLVALVLRRRHLIPEGLENVFTLSVVLALYQVSNALLMESGIAAVTVAGVVVGNFRSHVSRTLAEFKEQLTVMLIGLLFVLLAADVRMAEVVELGWAGVLTVLALVVVVRPLNVAAGTFRSGLSLRQKAFIAWMAPRGIVAAGVASLFAAELERAGLPGGDALRALVFLVIAGTVVLAGLGGGLMAGLLGLKRPSDNGWVILGAGDLARALAHALAGGGEEVVLIDANPDATRAAQEEDLRVIYGNGLEERTLARAEIDSRLGALGLTANEEVNLIFGRTAKAEGRLRRFAVALKDFDEGVTREMVHGAGGAVLFRRPKDVDLWSMRLRQQTARGEWWRLVTAQAGQDGTVEEDPSGAESHLALALRRGTRVSPVTDAVRYRKGDEVLFLIHAERRGEAERWLEERGWMRREESAQPRSG